MKKILFIISFFVFLMYCSNQDKKSDINHGEKKMFINDQTIKNTIENLINQLGSENKFRIEKGVSQTASLWKGEDGSKEDFDKFCTENFIADNNQLDKIFLRLSENFETIWGHFNKISLDLNRPIHLSGYDKLPIDEIFGAFSPYSHLNEDLFSNKIAFFVLLNFPHYSLEEKIKYGNEWTRKEWAYARMGDIFTSRVPAELLQKQSEAITNADIYISEYNIFMGNLVDDKGNTLFPKDLKLISHWGLRDELKSHYSDNQGGLEMQKIIYKVMNRIISQEIPECVINNNSYNWNPYSNKIFESGKEKQCTPESNTRYQHLINNFQAVKAIDAYSPNYPTYINRKFEEEFEIPQKEVEKLFTDFVSSPIVKDVAKIIEKRLGRKLQPFDIWYDGFKARSFVNENDLDKITMKKYPDPGSFKKDLPNILTKLGFNYDNAKRITSKIEVDPSKGAGHAWGAQMKSENAHLRTRIGENGMNYKGYNIATHEFGHNVEQTITLNDVDYYMLSGVPNTAFTEAWAFVFQKRDLELLGQKENNPNKHDMMVLDNFWSTYEIMGVSLVDMSLWKWLYDNPDANPKEVKNATIKIAKYIWNKYYAKVFGVKDQTILAIYSHMIDYPLYLSAYPLGHLIEFQIESFIRDKNLGEEMFRMCKQGRVIPQLWMKNAVGNELSIQPTLDAAKTSIENLTAGEM
jgi:hypothetical protein